MQVLPPFPAGIPAEMAIEIPLVVLQSNDGRWRLGMGPSRFDSSWTNKSPPTEPNLAESVGQCIDPLLLYFRNTGVRASRLALVVQRVCLVDSPAETLVVRFCNEASRREPFNRSESFEIHNHKVYTIRANGVESPINSWVRCKSARLVADKSPVVLVEQDLNTVAKENEPGSLDVDQIGAFFMTAAAEADEILRKYFPGQV
jgi:hypothetical protein